MQRLLIVIVVGLVAAAIAEVYRRRQPTAAPTATGDIPASLDRGDFVAPDAPWLLAVFTSHTCLACAGVVATLSGFESTTVALQNLEVDEQAELHKKYRIDSVPMALAVDREGLVQQAYVGPLSPDDRAELAALLS